MSALTPARGLALVRLAAVPLFLVAEKTVEDQVPPSPAFGWLLALAAVYAIAAAVAEWRWPGRIPASLFAALDFAVVVALIAASGGPFSQLRYALFVLPVTAATLVGPWRTALVSAGAVVAYVAIAATFPESRDAPPDALGFESAQTLFLAWVGLAAVLLSSVLTARAKQIQALADSRGRLVAQALDADDRTRRRLAEALHDEALQNLLAARQMLGGPLDGDAVALARGGLDEAVGQIRDAIFDLHPHLLEQAGLGPALEAVASRQAGRGGYVPSIRVDPAASGPQDELVFSIARELITNVTKHAGARRLDVDVAAANGAVELRVRDDGAGMDPDDTRGALLDGHIGLATARERAEAVGGRFELASGRGRGTEVVVRLPAG